MQKNKAELEEKKSKDNY